MRKQSGKSKLKNILLTLTRTLQQCQCHERTKDGDLMQIKDMEQLTAVHNLWLHSGFKKSGLKNNYKKLLGQQEKFEYRLHIR